MLVLIVNHNKHIGLNESQDCMPVASSSEPASEYADTAQQVSLIL